MHIRRWSLGICALAIAVRLFGMTTESIWGDEAFSAVASLGSVSEIAEMNARDIHPPGYYLGLSIWRDIAGRSDFALRSYSTFFSLVSLLLLMRLAYELFGWRVAWAAGLFAALNPLDIYFAQEARMYSQATALALATSLLLWRSCEAARASDDEGQARPLWPWMTGYAFCSASLLLTHYVAVTFLIGQGIVALAFFARRRDLRGLASYGAASLGTALLFLPWLLYVLSFRDTLVRPEGLEWMPVPGITDYFSFMGREYFWGRVHQVHSSWWPLTISLPLGILIAGIWSHWTSLRHDRRVPHDERLAQLPQFRCRFRVFSGTWVSKSALHFDHK